VPALAKKDLKPRKTPLQKRSQATVEALFEASVQVMRAGGYRAFTTTRVALRAGVSVGTLYQYFPNKQALIAAVIGRHLDAILATVAAACRQRHGQNLEIIVNGFIDAAIAAKLERIDLSIALQEPLSEIGGASLVKAMTRRAASAVGDAIDSSPDVEFDEAVVPSMIVVTACTALVQAALEPRSGSPDLETLRHHMSALVLGYLRAIGRAKHAPRKRPRRRR
jgi:AcrR family transcriptional regulator